MVSDTPFYPATGTPYSANLEILKKEDRLVVQFEGVQYEYKIKQSGITAAEDRMVIVSKEQPVLTLTTCYPFNFLGAAPDRSINEALLVNITEMES